MASGNNWNRVLRVAVDVISSIARNSRRANSRQLKTPSSRQRATWKSRETSHSRVEDHSSPGQFGPGATRDATDAEVRQADTSYSPNIDGAPDPGEVVWTWVPYVEHDGRGKDRPVLITGRLDQDVFTACYLSTKQHEGYVSVGAGPWDSRGRESFMNPHRVLRVTTSGMRRESSVMPKAQYLRALKSIH